MGDGILSQEEINSLLMGHPTKSDILSQHEIDQLLSSGSASENWTDRFHGDRKKIKIFDIKRIQKITKKDLNRLQEFFDSNFKNAFEESLNSLDIS